MPSLIRLSMTCLKDGQYSSLNDLGDMNGSAPLCSGKNAVGAAPHVYAPYGIFVMKGIFRSQASRISFFLRKVSSIIARLPRMVSATTSYGAFEKPPWYFGSPRA